MTAVDDFVGLAQRTGPRDRWLALGGPSGSGKSTLAAWLVATHPAWQGPRVVIDRRPLDVGSLPVLAEPHIIVVDEVTTVGQLAQVVRLLVQGHRAVVPTHLPRPAFAAIALGWAGQFVATGRHDEGHAKIARALTRRGLRFSMPAVRAYVRTFGAVYPEIDLVLERCPTRDFDRALAWFLKFHHRTLSPADPIGER